MMRLRSQLTTFQLAPPSSLRHTDPWSFVWINAYMRCGFEGAMDTSILPSGGFGSPLAVVRCVQVCPLSCEMYTPLPGPPLSSAQVRTLNCQVPASTVSGWPGSMLSPLQPVSSLTNSVCFQVLPPSVVRNTPRSRCGAAPEPSAQTSTLSVSFGLIRISAIRPVFGNPMCFQVVPPSVDLYTPSPTMSLGRIVHGSPVPTQTVSWSAGATAIAPIADVSCSSKTGLKVCPPSVDFHSPPDAEPR